MAIGTPLEILTLRAPTLAVKTTAADYLALAETLTGSVFEAQRSLAVALLAGHWLTADELGSSVSGGGFIASESEGSLSRSYQHANAFMSGADDSLGTTAFGKELLALRRSCVMSIRNSFV